MHIMPVMKKQDETLRKRTTIYVNPLIHKEVHISAIRQGRIIAECIEEAFLDFIKKYEKETKPKKF